MKILVASLYFYPDHSGIAVYSTDFARYAASKGHSVEVITGFPFYPQWKKLPGDRWSFVRTESNENLRILRGFLYVPSRPTTMRRLLQEATFLAFAFINFFRASKPDVIVVFSTPVSLAWLCAFFSWWYKCRLVVNVQDFQIEAAESLGMAGRGSLLKGLPIRAFEWIEAIGFRAADFVSSISHSMLNLLESKKGVSKSKILFWPNWVDLSKYESLPARNSFRERHEISRSATLIAYAGNIGLKQGLEVLIDVAGKFRNDTNVQFLIAGAGAAMADLKSYAADSGVRNVLFMGLLDEEEYISLVRDVDVFFISQKRVEYDVYFPSKLLGLMAMSSLMLLSADSESELYKTLQANDLAPVCNVGDVEAIVAEIRLLIQDPQRGAGFRERANTFVRQYERKIVLDRILETISQRRK